MCPVFCCAGTALPDAWEGAKSHGRERHFLCSGADGVLRVSGQRLTLLAMTGEELRIGGLIDRVEWVTGC